MSDRFIKQNQIAEKLGISLRTVKRHFKVLTENNIIRRV